VNVQALGPFLVQALQQSAERLLDGVMAVLRRALLAGIRAARFTFEKSPYGKV
jgi:hypothetical protein